MHRHSQVEIWLCGNLVLQRMECDVLFTGHHCAAVAFESRPIPTRCFLCCPTRSDDQRMGSLFQRIAREIGDRVEGAIDLRHIFRMPPADAVLLIKASKSVLEHWVLTYMKVRKAVCCAA